LALLLAAPASGQGKTTITAVLARYYRQQGKQVRVFKAGPDFLDPMILRQASGHPVYQLDLWLVGKQGCRQLLAKAAEKADIILIEGVMGLFDGDPSSADLAAYLNIPVLAIINASAMAQTFGALAYGLAYFRQDISVVGIVANQVGSDRHYQMLVDSLPNDLPCVASLNRQKDVALPSRHLGLIQADEISDLEHRLTQMTKNLIVNNDIILPTVSFPEHTFSAPPRLLHLVTIAVAQDAAFSFIYQANLDLLTAMGATLVFFSPLEAVQLPECDSLYLPGGYPELHLKALASNLQLHSDIKAHYRADKPIVAECGGMLYLTESLTDKNGEQSPMVSLLNGHAVLQDRLTALALQEVTLNNRILRGHTYHHSTFETSCSAAAIAHNPNGKYYNESVYQQRRLTASYIHFYFPSNPDATASLFAP
jgi:cobyrinic acid a,c-diamide synthase